MNKPNNRFFEFDNFRADPQNKCLWYGSELVSLTPKAFDTLLVLLENKGQVVNKNTLLDQVWGDTFVEEAALKQNISTLRKKFESLQTGKQFIETIPRRGYRFIGEAKEIYDEEEVYLVETHTRTHIIANQEINLSGETTFTTQIKRRKLILTGVLAVIIVLTASFFALRYFRQPQPMSENKFREFEIKQITASGNIHRIAISPNGKYLALVEKKDDLQTLFLRQTDKPKNIEIIPPTKDDIIGITFSPDNQAIYFTVYPFSEPKQMPRVGVLKQIPILGGATNEILKNIDSPVSVSPDGKKFSFIRHNFKERQSSIILAEAIAPNLPEKVLAFRSIQERFIEDRIAWSPDGKRLALIANSLKDSDKPFELITVEIEHSEPKILSNESWNWMGQLAWLNDGSGVILTALKGDSPNFTDEIWTVSYPEGKLRKITNGINGFFGLGVSTDSSTLATVKSDRIVSLWSSPANNLQAAKLIRQSVNTGSAYKFGMDVSADKKLVYSDAQLGNADIWLMNSDGSQPQQLTNDTKADISPTVSPDGRYIVFISNRSGTKNIWRMNLDGTNQVQLTKLTNVFSPTFSPDGNWVYFSAGQNINSKLNLWRVPINGGDTEKLNDLLTLEPKISPDGKYIACFYPENGELTNQAKPLKLSVISTADYSIVKQFNIISNKSSFDWKPDSKSVTYFETKGKESTLFSQMITGGEPQKLLVMANENILNHRWSQDGENLIIEKGTVVNDIVLIKEKSN